MYKEANRENRYHNLFSKLDDFEIKCIHNIVGICSLEMLCKLELIQRRLYYHTMVLRWCKQVNGKVAPVHNN
jgi:hypothetical protein